MGGIDGAGRYVPGTPRHFSIDYVRNPLASCAASLQRSSISREKLRPERALGGFEARHHLNPVGGLVFVFGTVRNSAKTRTRSRRNNSGVRVGLPVATMFDMLASKIGEAQAFADGLAANLDVINMDR